MRFIFFIIILLLFSLVNPVIGQATPEVSANNAILIEQSTGRVLYEKDAHEPELIASITKIMTALIAIESDKMKEKAKISRKAIYTEGSSIYLEQGEKMTIEDLVYGLMLRSGNDAAVAISEHIGGSEEGFVYLMNEKAKWLGMTNSSFENPHGLDSDNHYSSAYDMALLMRSAMKNEEFRKITGTTSYKSENRSYSWQNKNKLLTQYYDSCTGGKTGYTKKTGRTLVTTASKNGMDLIAVTLNAPDDWRDHINMFEWGFDNYDMESIAKKGEIQYKLKKTDKSIPGFTRNDIFYPLTEAEKDNIKKKSYLLKEDNRVADDTIGKTVFYLDDIPIAETTIYNEENRPREDKFYSLVLSMYQKIIGFE
ncbi:D-alanyl-D-alanine carboxypeptidase [Virgibacillus profundi]|uniref:serine-type D-Ala-D-Ala carboxypeptidase n=1 Tax=Virgibacillus profundi TaxID=2024555 RepID=A0A2A2ID29_9BACI|nr:D-alanyl-D-alanine carboxypeptidase family protein [Virgibacillus profundi]PAV29537.1 D-alanyl-D-alanine carboxypeptidase [Virgibacillus profundi]PXY53707.1 D-alanyl-D-alanine carboxypeptidase [Virgibacillus profundi]